MRRDDKLGYVGVRKTVEGEGKRGLGREIFIKREREIEGENILVGRKRDRNGSWWARWERTKLLGGRDKDRWLLMVVVVVAVDVGNQCIYSIVVVWYGVCGSCDGGSFFCWYSRGRGSHGWMLV